MRPTRLSIAAGAAALLALGVSAAGASAATAALPTSTVAKSSRPEARYGDPGQITATVRALKAGAGTPTGEVEFTVDGETIYPNVALTAGKAALPLAWMYYYGVGPHTVVAHYLGESGFEASTSAPVTQMLVGRTEEASSTLTLNENGKYVFSPTAFSLRYQEPLGCNVAIHNTTPNAVGVLYGYPGTWKALKYAIPAGATRSVGVGAEGVNGYFTVSGASNYIKIACK